MFFRELSDSESKKTFFDSLNLETKKLNLETSNFRENRTFDFDENFTLFSPQYCLSESKDHLSRKNQVFRQKIFMCQK